MNLKKHFESIIRGWLPKEFSLPSHQRIKMVDHFMRLQLLLRLTYGVMLGALLVTPFGVYHSTSEPYITGFLWGYHLPIGYVGLLLGIAVILYPRLNTLRSLRFSSFVPFIGLFLLLSFFFSPNCYFINLIHGTNFSSGQIDVDFPVGNSAVLGLSLLSIIFGLISVFTRYPKKEATDQSEVLKPKKYLNGVRGWLPKEPSVAYANKPPKHRWRRPYWITLTLVVVIALAFATYAGVQTYLRYSNPRLDVTASYYEKTLNCSTASVGDVVEVKVRVGWHGYVIPEFKRDVKIIDPFPEGNFVLVNGTNVYEYKGYGGSDQFTYTLRVVAEEGVVELPKPRLYLDNVEISINGTSPTVNISSK